MTRYRGQCANRGASILTSIVIPFLRNVRSSFRRSSYILNKKVTLAGHCINHVGSAVRLLIVKIVSAAASANVQL